MLMHEATIARHLIEAIESRTESVLRRKEKK
jgi:hypothetical protein